MKLPFLFEWIVANVIGFTIGNILGNGEWGLVTGFRGDLISGAVFGVVQAFVLVRHSQTASWRPYLWWTAATALGFMTGVFFGRRFTPWHLMADNATLVGLIFGLMVGLIVSVLQWIVLRWSIVKSPSANWWLVGSIIAWLIGEGLTSVFGNTLGYMPIFGIIFALSTGFIWHWRIKPQV